MKFGGTSVANFEAISRTVGIVETRVPRKPVVCVSALSGITDLLYRIADRASRSERSETKELLDSLRSRHIALAQSLLSGHPELFDKAAGKVGELCDGLSAVTASVLALGELPDRIKAVIISYGELLSSTIISFAMNSRGIRTAFVDARQMIITDGEYLKGVPDMEQIERRVPQIISRAFEGNEAVITQGFISATATGAGTVLGRGGSDYSASLIGAALDAEAIEIWTDVDGIHSSDPRVVHDTRRIDRLSFPEAAMMAQYGAKVLHPMTIAPAVRKSIPIYVLNSMMPSAPGTVILNDSRCGGAKAVAFKRNVYLVEISGISESALRDELSRRRLKADIFLPRSESDFVLTLDFTQRIGGVIEDLAERCGISLHTGVAQISVIGSGMHSLPAFLTARVPEIAASGVRLETPENFSFTLPRDRMEDCVRGIHKCLFETSCQ